jgi:hypothetical protein
MPFVSSLFSFGPKISRDGKKLVARTSVPVLLLTLGLAWKRVVVDPDARTVTITSRFLFGLIPTERRIPFDSVDVITYDYGDLNPTTALGFTGDAIDRFAVGLKLHGERVHTHLFSFTGDGSFQNESIWPDWMYWEEMAFDMRGTQEEESKVFVSLLEKMLKRSIRPS